MVISRDIYPLKLNEIVKEIMVYVHVIGHNPVTGLVETFYVGLIETCFNYPIATLYAIIHFGIDRTNT